MASHLSANLFHKLVNGDDVVEGTMQVVVSNLIFVYVKFLWLTCSFPPFRIEEQWQIAHLDFVWPFQRVESLFLVLYLRLLKREIGRASGELWEKTWIKKLFPCNLYLW